LFPNIVSNYEVGPRLTRPELFSSFLGGEKGMAAKVAERMPNGTAVEPVYFLPEVSAEAVADGFSCTKFDGSRTERLRFGDVEVHGHDMWWRDATERHLIQTWPPAGYEYYIDLAFSNPEPWRSHDGWSDNDKLVPLSAGTFGLIPLLVPVWDSVERQYDVTLFDGRGRLVKKYHEECSYVKVAWAPLWLVPGVTQTPRGCDDEEIFEIVLDRIAAIL
jgi:hypothetical protein